MPAKNTLNNQAWEALFTRHNIINAVEQNGVFRISATTINQAGREARLMTYSDREKSLPKIFKDNRLNIISDARGSYLIGRFSLYQSIADDPNAEIAELPFPNYIETIDPNNIYSEPAGILCAYNTQMLRSLADEDLYFTVNGRMSSGSFDYLINAAAGNQGEAISVANTQIEIDGGFEGATKFLVIEAKNYGAEDFNIKQLYYPYRLWREKTSKQVIPIFMTLSNDVFSFYVYRFRDPSIYNSIELVEQRKYRIAPVEIELADLLAVLAASENLPPTAAPDVPVPQADVFPRVVDLLGLAQANGFLTYEQIAEVYIFTGRQADYYQNAARYLGLLERERDPETRKSIYTLTDEGTRIMKMPSRQKFLALAGKILQNPVFSRTLRKYIDDREQPSKAEVCRIMVEERVPLNETTVDRRARTVLGWVNWILELQNE
jgi:hypothetical protein